MRQALQCIGARRLASRRLAARPRDPRSSPGCLRVYTLRTRVNVERDRLELAAADFNKALAMGPAESVLTSFRAYAAEAIEKKHAPHALWYLNHLTEAAAR